MMSLMFYWVTAKLLTRNQDWVLKEKIKITYQKLVSAFVFFKVSKIINNNFDVKRTILKLFFVEYWFNTIAVVILTLINILNNSTLFYIFFDSKATTEINWINFLIFHLLFLIFTIRLISDCYKLSLRTSYRQQYLKIILLDLLILNFLSFCSILIYKKTAQQTNLKSNDNYQLNYQLINAHEVKAFFKAIFKIEFFISITSFSLFFLAIIIGYYAEDSFLRTLCLILLFITMIFIYAWIPQKLIPVLILQRMFKRLLNNCDYYLLLIIFRFLLLMFGYYHVATLINLLAVSENLKEIILENF